MFIPVFPAIIFEDKISLDWELVMARRIHPRNTPRGMLRMATRFPWQLLIIVPLLVTVALATFLYTFRMGGKMLPSVTQLFYKLSDTDSSVISTPPPSFLSTLPQVGSILYTVQTGESCDSILENQMSMIAAGEVFSDANPATVQALNSTLGQDCNTLQPGLVLSLFPQYPLVALGGIVLKIESPTSQQLVPTPLIYVPNHEQQGPDCSNGCRLLVRVNPHTQVYLTVKTLLSIRVGSWVWAQAMLARKAVSGFDNYPYADPKARLNGMVLPVCDFQVDNIHDDNATLCQDIMPNTIRTDRGAWLLSVIGPSALDHWHYALPHLAVGTRVMIWLSLEKGSLIFQAGNPVYRYDDGSHLYVKV
jgi:hypothetical protein